MMSMSCSFTRQYVFLISCARRYSRCGYCCERSQRLSDPTHDPSCNRMRHLDCQHVGPFEGIKTYDQPLIDHRLHCTLTSLCTLRNYSTAKLQDIIRIPSERMQLMPFYSGYSPNLDANFARSAYGEATTIVEMWASTRILTPPSRPSSTKHQPGLLRCTTLGAIISFFSCQGPLVELSDVNDASCVVRIFLQS